MSIYIIGDRNTVLGFRLAGADGRIAGSPDEAHAGLDAALELKDVEILFITQEWARVMRSRLENLHKTIVRPLILEIPGSQDEIWEQPFTAYIRKTIGLTGKEQGV